MAVFLAWSAAVVPADVSGPWTQLLRLADGLTLVESTEGLSRVYHELKWALPEGTALLVAPLAERPKLKGLPDGTTTWLRDRIAGPAR
ncbi:hypothetical protein [Nocardioides sp. L-11A]|uniref:hypothetical protein n=1 Tax=Nocardioides sp. L-11A TaxID=3043848 RepID=UPI00249CC981|nr:hypothetical protein QJ852_11650 [Nocardioides sp. L-11A]